MHRQTLIAGALAGALTLAGAAGPVTAQGAQPSVAQPSVAQPAPQAGTAPQEGGAPQASGASSSPILSGSFTSDFA